MVITALVVAIGVLVGTWVTYVHDLRLSGVIVIPLLAVYTLINFAALPVFVVSAILAYAGILVVQDRWLLYGRSLLLVAILFGAIIPVVTFLVLEGAVGRSIAVDEVDFLGSILPGIAAYNFYRLDTEKRALDLLASAGLLVTLFVVGLVALVSWERPPSLTRSVFGVSAGDYVTPVLLGAESDIAGALDLSLHQPQPVVGTVLTVAAVVTFGLVLSEGTRFRWGLRPAGVIVLPLLALFALRAWWMLPLFVVVSVLTYAGTRGVHTATLLYGRALLSVAIVASTVVALVLQVALGLPYGLSVFFVGLLAGIGAYNLHVVAPQDRSATVAVSAGIFVVLFGVARLFISPLPGGLVVSVSVVHVVTGIVALGAASWTIYRLERRFPTAREINEASPFRQEVDE